MLGQILFAVPRSLVPIEHRAGLGIVNLCKGKVQDQEKTKILGEIELLRTSLIHDNSSESAADKFKINI